MFGRLAKQAKSVKAKKARRTGQRFEYVARDWFLQSCSLIVKSVRRVPLSGGGSDKGDLVVTLRTGQEFRVECKYRQDGFKFLYDVLSGESNIAFLSAANSRRLLLFDEYGFLEFMQEVYNLGYQHGREGK